ncbi:MAG: translation elongation factor-like protein [Patescibacteria group bacterium]
MKNTGKKIGTVTHYYDRLKVAIVKLGESVKKGDKLTFKGNTTDFTQIVDDMQVDHQDVTKAEKGQEVGIKVNEKVRDSDLVYKPV